MWLLWELSLGGSYRLHYQGDKNQQARKNISNNQQPKHTAKKYYLFHM
jgi:hypothetical protein